MGELRRRLTPGRALRRPKARAIMLFLVAREDTAKSVSDVLLVSRSYTYKLLRGLREIEFVDRMVEEGTYPAFRTSEKGIQALVEKGLISRPVEVGGVKMAAVVEVQG